MDGGAEDESTLRENCKAFCDFTFRPRQAVKFPDYNLRTTVLGMEISFPAFLAPVGYNGADASRRRSCSGCGYGRCGYRHTLSTISGHKLEECASGDEGPAWFQLYLVGGRGCSGPTIGRARNAGFNALAVTIVRQSPACRGATFRNGMKEMLGGSFFQASLFVGCF